MTRTKRKGWTNTYWDIVSQIYWVPPYIGLKSIPRKLWVKDGERISIPANLTSANGPLYYRKYSETEFWPYIERQEETFNHVLDLVLNILAPRDVGDLLQPLLKLPSGLELAPVGRSLNEFMHWPEHANNTTPDIFLVDETALVMVELKFNATTSMDQFGKYIALAVRDGELRGARENLILSFLVASENPAKALSSQLGMSLDATAELKPSDIATSVRNPTIKELLLKEPDRTQRVLNSVRIRAVSWKEVYKRVVEVASNTSSDMGGRTASRLLSGLAEAIAYTLCPACVETVNLRSRAA